MAKLATAGQHLAQFARTMPLLNIDFTQCAMGRLPNTIVVDGGSEFCSLGFETVAAACRMTPRQRPIAAARHGSVIERTFGTGSTPFVQRLNRTTVIARKRRQPRRLNKMFIALGAKR